MLGYEENILKAINVLFFYIYITTNAHKNNQNENKNMAHLCIDYMEWHLVE